MSGVEKIEGVGRFEDHFVGGQRQARFDEPAAFPLTGVEPGKQRFRVSPLEVIGGHFHLVLVEHVSVADAAQGTVRPG